MSNRRKYKEVLFSEFSNKKKSNSKEFSYKKLRESEDNDKSTSDYEKGHTFSEYWTKNNW